MANHPYQREPGVLYAPVVTDPPAGLRSLISELHAYVAPSLGRWAIPVRLAVAVACFAGGFVCARLFVQCLLGDPGACPCVLPRFPSLAPLALALVLLFATSVLTPAKTNPRRYRVLAARVFSGLLQPVPTCQAGTSHG